MIKRIWLALLIILIAGAAFAGTWTVDNIFYKPDVDEEGYGANVNAGFDNAAARVRYLHFDDALYNSFFGNGSGNAITSGNYNLFFGYHAGILNTTGNYNSFIGAYSGSTNDVGAYNTYIGANTGKVSTGSNNMFIGYNAGYNNTSGYQNVFLGAGAGQANTIGHGNFFAGPNAGYSNTDHSFNTFLGNNSGYNATGSGNTGIGTNACYAMGSASSGNVCIGDSAGFKQTTGSNNAYIGIGSGYEVLNATSNVCIGNSACRYANSGYNTALGTYSLYRNIGSNNIGIGYAAGYWETGSNKFYVNSFFHNNLAEDQTLSLLYGQTDASPAHQFLTVNGNLNVSAFGNPALNVTMNAGLETAKFTNISSQGSSNGPGLLFLQDDASAMASGNRLGYITFAGVYSAPHSFTDTVGISAYATENWSGTNKGSRLAFRGTPTGSATQAEWATFLDGKLGIGTAAPLMKLDAVTPGSSNQIASRAYSTTVTQSGNFVGYKSHSATEALVTTVDGEYLGQYGAEGVNYAGSPAWAFGGIITFMQNGNQTAGDIYIPTDILFKNSPGGTTGLTERMRIDKNGALLLGTSIPLSSAIKMQTSSFGTSPSQTLNIDYSTTTSDRAYYILAKSHSATEAMGTTVDQDYLGQLNFTGVNYSASPTMSTAAAIRTYQNGNQTNGDTAVPADMAFFTSPGGSTSITERVRISKLGNFGFGTTTPDAAPYNRFSVASIAPGFSPILGHFVYDTGNSNTPSLVLQKSHSATEALVTTVDTEILGQLRFRGVNNAGTPAVSSAGFIQVTQNGTQAGGDTAVPGDMGFYTSQGGSTTAQERLRIDKNGQIIIAAGGYLKVPVGSNVSSAATIAPTGMIFHVTGTTGVSLITIPYSGWTGSVTIIPDGIFTTSTSGTQSGLNYPIALATTTVVSKALIMTFDGTKWYPSY